MPRVRKPKTTATKAPRRRAAPRKRAAKTAGTSTTAAAAVAAKVTWTDWIIAGGSAALWFGGGMWVLGTAVGGYFLYELVTTDLMRRDYQDFWSEYSNIGGGGRGSSVPRDKAKRYQSLKRRAEHPNTPHHEATNARARMAKMRQDYPGIEYRMNGRRRRRRRR